MKTWLALAVFVLAGGFTSVMAQTWRIGDDQPFPLHITDIPLARQRSILKRLQPTFQEWQVEPKDIDAISKGLRLRRVVTPAGPLLLIQGWGVESCGGVGNCALWVMGKDDKILLADSAEVVKISNRLHHGMPMILLSQHDSASESERNWYSFDGSRYREVSCATETSWTPQRSYSPPRIVRHPCGE